MACVWRDPWPVITFEAPPELRLPAVVMMCASCIVQDETTGMMYMDTITTSMGQVALVGPHSAIQALGPTIEDITNTVHSGYASYLRGTMTTKVEGLWLCKDPKACA